MRTILNEGRLLIRQLRPRQLVLVEPRRSLDEGGQYMESTCHLFDSLNFISHVLLMFLFWVGDHCRTHFFERMTIIFWMAAVLVSNMFQPCPEHLGTMSSFPHLPGEDCYILYKSSSPSSSMLPPRRAPFPAPDRSGHCRTSIASSRSMWALLESAGSQPPGPDRSGHMHVGAAETQLPAQLSIADLNRQRRQLSIALGTAGARTTTAVGTAGPQPPGHNRSEQCRMPDRMLNGNAR